MMCGITFIITFIINIPFYLAFMPGSQIIHTSRNATFTVWFSANTPFSTTQLGIVLTFACYALRDVVIMAVQIVLNIASILYLKAHLAKKKRIMSTPGGAASRVSNTRLKETRAASQRPQASSRLQANASAAIDQDNHNTRPSVNKNNEFVIEVSAARVRTQSVVAGQQVRNQISPADQRATVMVYK
jgi:hypothetical protein